MRFLQLKPGRSRSTTVPVVSLLLSLWHLTAAANAPSRYLIVDKTQSPSHRYALAWGLPGNTPDWARLDRDQHYADSLNLDNAANYIVDLRTRRILTTIQGNPARFGDGHFWKTPNGTHPNHFDLDAVWAPHEKTLVVIYGGKWNYVGIKAFRLSRHNNATVVSHQTSIGADVEAYVRHYVARTQPQDYAHDKDRIVIDVYKPQLLDNNHLSLDVEAQVPKAEGLDFTGHLELVLYPVGHTLHTRLVEIHKTKS